MIKWITLLGYICGLSVGFLEDELPLSIVTTTPTNLMDPDTDVISVRGQQAITVVFSRPVIALGSDFAQQTIPSHKVPFSFSTSEIAGSFRWVTTYIARWDPEGEWPSDWEVDLVWNQALTTWDDVPLNLTEVPPTATLRTPTLSFDITYIHSEMAKSLTDDEWGPYTSAGQDDFEPEVPPDAVVTVSFNYPVNLTLLNASFLVTQDGQDTDINVLVFPCVTPYNKFVATVQDSSCAQLTLQGDLDVAGQYMLSLPQGVKYHPLSGPLRQSLEYMFYGLKEFRIPFQRRGSLAETKNEVNRIGLEYRRFDIWLLHGLAEYVTLADLKSLITLQKVPFNFNGTLDARAQSLDFELELINKGRLQLKAQVEPSTKYVISMQASNNITDGFGLPLKLPLYVDDEFEDLMVFNMKGLDGVFKTFSSNIIFEDIDGQGYQWPLFSRKTVSKLNKLFAWEVTEKNLMDVLVGMYSYDGDKARDLRQQLGKPDVVLQGSKDALMLDIQEVGAQDLLSESGAFITQYCCQNRFFQGETRTDATNANILFKTTLNFVNLQVGNQYFILITDMKSGLPLVNVSASIYLLGAYQERVKPQLLADSMSNKQGVATLDLTDFMAGFDNLKDTWKNQYVIVLQTGDGAIYFGTVSPPDRVSSNSDLQIFTVKDRQLVRPGETLKIKGYGRSRDAGQFIIPQNFSVFGTLNTPFVEKEEDDDEQFLGMVDQEFGSFTMEIAVPEEARLQEYSVAIYIGREQYAMQYGTSESFTVADPRPPTATLDVQVPDWVKPNGTVNIEVQVTSLIGATVQAEMTVTWTIMDIQGVDKITTDATGSGVYSLDLSQYGNITTDSQLEVQVEWIGPTRERITSDVAVPIQLSDKIISIASSLSTNVPGIQFELQATVTGTNSNETNVFIYAKNITDYKLMHGKLYEDSISVKDFIGAEYDLSESDVLFEVVGNGCGVGKKCTYKIPDYGQYVIAACFQEENDLICNGMFRGLTFQNWTDSPLASHFFLSAREQYLDGDETAKFFIDVPYEKVESLIVWGNQLETKTQRESLASGMQSVEIVIGDECIGGCQVNVALTVPRQRTEFVQPVAVPTSNLFDPASPYTQVLEFSLTKTVVPTDLKVEVSVEQDVIEPGQNTTVSVQVFNCNIGGNDCTQPSDNVEVTVIGVDKSILQALPYFPTLEKFIIDLISSSKSYSLTEQLIAPDAIETVLAFIKQINEIDPFVPLTQLFDITTPNRWQQKQPVDGSIQEFLSQFKTDLTTFGSKSQVFFPPRYVMSLASASFSVAESMALPAAAAGASTAGEVELRGVSPASSSVSVRMADDFVTTPLFIVFKTTANGVGEASFSAPVNLGTFVIRAYAMSSGIQNGQAETELIVRRGVSLTAALPRGVRVGDEFEAGAVITVTGGQIANVDVSVTLSIQADPSPLTVNADFSKVVQTAADGTVEVTFPFIALTTGQADLKITVQVADGAADALQVTFPVAGVQDAVVVASSFAVQGSQPKGTQSGWTEGLKLPDALPGSGSVNLLAGVGRLPAIQTIASVLFKNQPFYRSPQAYHTLASLLVKPILDAYGIADTELYATATSKFEESLLNLTVGNLTFDGHIGLMYSIPEEGPFDVVNTDVYLNAYAAFVGKQVLGFYEETVELISEEQKTKITSLIDLWSQAAEKQMIEDAIEARTSRFPGPYWSLTNIALVRYLRFDGLTWQPEINNNNDKVVEQVVEDLSLQRLLDNQNSLSVETAAYLAQLLLRNETQDRPEVQDILDRFTSSMRVGGRTAYISFSPGSTYPVSPYDQSMALITYSSTQNFNALVEKLANYLGGPLNNNGVASSYLGDKSSAAVMLALAKYDAEKGSTDPNLKLTAASGNYTLLEATFDDASDLPVESSTPWESLDSPPAPIEVKAEGVGEATVAALLDFVPKNLITFPVYRGFHVTTIIQKADPVNQAPTGPPLSKVPLGTVVAITIQVVTPDRYSSSQVRVLMPGGLEPIDPNLDADAEGCFLPWLRTFRSRGSFSWFASWWCPDQETRPQVVTFDVSRIGPGALEFNVLAVAATRGRFVLPSVKTFVVDEPETLGLSAAGWFEVCENCEAVSVEDTISAPLECPNECSGLGVCDVATGTCQCNDGFVGDDCSGFAEQ